MYDQLRQLIIDGIARDGLQPGDPLPGEHRLCERYGISRTVVRQALAQLEHEGLVERVKGKGTFVSRPRTSESLVHTLVGLYDDVERRGGHVHSDVLRHERDRRRRRDRRAPSRSSRRARRRARTPASRRRRALVALHDLDAGAVGAVTLDVDLSEASLYRLLADNGIVGDERRPLGRGDRRDPRAGAAPRRQRRFRAAAAAQRESSEPTAARSSTSSRTTAAIARASSSSCSRSSRRRRCCTSTATAGTSRAGTVS